MAEENVRVELTIPVPAARVFAVLADPAAHCAIDGTGWVEAAIDPAPLTGAGQVFRIRMYHPNHPDGHYQMANRVEVFAQDRAIGWRPGQENERGELEFGGWTWRYDLTPAGPSETRVRLTYDWSAVPQHIREYIAFPPFAPDHLANSLRHLGELAEPARQG
ncbi:SRPBCC family protein [Pseudonocardia dioxanivorans]|uniref:polyketide cyclase n=1 Tax=Pseudonocardia dioxanivorans TaxID=240495 RepID=UPI000CD10154|nr:polyketide cyclase [Pseudonocardia dioxanivorans]